MSAHPITTHNPALSPAQTQLATAAAERLLELRELHRIAGVAPMPDECLSIPLDELECLARAAAPALGMEVERFDLGAWVAPR